MKICPKCNTGNDNHAIQCKDCGASISQTGITQQNFVEERSAGEEKRHRRKMLVHNIVLPVLGIAYVSLYIKALSKANPFQVTLIAVVLPLIAYLNIHHPRVLFVIRNIFTIDNIDDVELSDWYVIGTKISGYICIAAALVFMSISAFVA